MHPPTYVIVVVVVIDVVVLMDKSLQYRVLLDPKLEIQAKMGVSQDHLEVVQAAFEKAEKGKSGSDIRGNVLLTSQCRTPR